MREPVVSRTFKGLMITALMVNPVNRAQEELTLFIERVPEGKKRLNYIQKRFESLSAGKFVTILNEQSVTRRFAMTEQEFIEKAHEVELLSKDKEQSEQEAE